MQFVIFNTCKSYYQKHKVDRFPYRRIQQTFYELWRLRLDRHEWRSRIGWSLEYCLSNTLDYCWKKPLKNHFITIFIFSNGLRVYEIFILIANCWKKEFVKVSNADVAIEVKYKKSSQQKKIYTYGQRRKSLRSCMPNQECFGRRFVRYSHFRVQQARGMNRGSRRSRRYNS